MVLVDTSVWVDHVRAGSNELSRLLKKGMVARHKWVHIELTAWTPPDRAQFLADYLELPLLESVYTDELIDFIELNKFYGRGCGAVDLSLLATCAMTDSKLWTKDRRLYNLAEESGLNYDY